MEKLREEIAAFLYENLGTATGALTGTDMRALCAVAGLMNLYAYTRDESLLPHFKTYVEMMQRKTRWFAFHVVASQLDWSDRAEVWVKSGLPFPIDGLQTCKHEPRRQMTLKGVG